jgi:hypothetical protein
MELSIADEEMLFHTVLHTAWDAHIQDGEIVNTILNWLCTFSYENMWLSPACVAQAAMALPTARSQSAHHRRRFRMHLAKCHCGCGCHQLADGYPSALILPFLIKGNKRGEAPSNVSRGRSIC